RGLLDQGPDRRDMAAESDTVAGEAAEVVREWSRPGEVERQLRHLLPRGRKRAQQHLVPLDRDQPADAEEPRLVAGVGRRFLAGGDSVVDDLEGVRGEALALGEIVGEAARDRDPDLGEARDRAISEAKEAVVAELVESVLGREAQRHTREHAGGKAV